MGVFCAALALAFVVTAVVVQRAASTPVGEGELFVAHASTAEETLRRHPDPDEAVRRVRNSLDVEAVSLIGEEGLIVASTSSSMLGYTPANPLLQGAAAEGRLAAIADGIGAPIMIDGVLEWPAGSVLYQLTTPVGDLGSVLIHYDLSDLVARRAIVTGIQTETLQLLALAVVFTVIGGGVVAGNTRAERKRRDAEAESELLRVQSAMLATANLDLDKARKEAERALALAEEKIRIRSDFVLMINHELRTPLTSVVTGARLIQDENLSPEDREQVIEAMIADSARLQEIIDQILTVARIENQGLSYQLSESALRSVIEVVQTTLPGLVPEASSQPEQGLMLHTDARALGMVLASLADNARTHGAGRVSIDYGTTPHIEPMVEVGDRPETAFYFSVADDGPGIPSEFLPRLFEKFEKSSFSSGTGLGLYMVRLMVEALQGSLAVKTSSRGTTFQIAIPLVPSSDMAGVW